jgi:hypothetical protein
MQELRSNVSDRVRGVLSSLLRCCSCSSGRPPGGAAFRSSGGLNRMAARLHGRRDQAANILDPPRGDLRSELYRRRVATGFDTLPPSRPAYGEDGGNRRVRLLIADDLREAKVANFRKMVHAGLLPSKVMTVAPTSDCSRPEYAGSILARPLSRNGATLN